MVKFGVETVAEAMKLGQEAAGKVTEKFIKPIKLEFEKVSKFPGSKAGPHIKFLTYQFLLQLAIYLTFRFISLIYLSTKRDMPGYITPLPQKNMTKWIVRELKQFGEIIVS